jgi:hypothetical protein
MYQCSALHVADGVLPNLSTSPADASWAFGHLCLKARMPSLTVCLDKIRGCGKQKQDPSTVTEEMGAKAYRKIRSCILGKSRMREIRLSGSVEGVVSNHDPYSDFDLFD